MTFPQFPREVVRIMGREMSNMKHTIRTHFRARHESTAARQACRNWIAEFRRVDNGCGYSIALKMVVAAAARKAEEEAALVKAESLRKAGKLQVLLVQAGMPLVRVAGGSLHELREDVFDAAANTARFGQYEAAMMGGEPYAAWN